MAGANPQEQSGFIEWLSTQWFWLVALVTGATHAAKAQSDISRLKEDSKKHDTAIQDIAVMKNDIAWIKKHLEEQK